MKKMKIEIIGTTSPQVVLRALNEYFNNADGSSYAMPCDAEYAYENGKLTPHADGDEPVRVKLTWGE